MHNKFWFDSWESDIPIFFISRALCIECCTVWYYCCICVDKPLSRKETLVATSSRDKTIRIWNTQTGATLSTLTVPGGFANAKREEMGAKPRVWVALAWPPGSSGEIISSGLQWVFLLIFLRSRYTENCYNNNVLGALSNSLLHLGCIATVYFNRWINFYIPVIIHI